MSDPIFDPERDGYAPVGEIDRAGSYEFDIFAVWRKVADGSLWYATDSGCSCPSPFESTTLADLQPFTEQALRSWTDGDDAYRTTPAMDVADLLAKCRESSTPGLGGSGNK